jgi:hypothetical protein
VYEMNASRRPAILFLNVGWMIRYTGPSPDDPTRGNFKWLNAGGRPHGHECYNFADKGGRCFGCHPGDVGTDIGKLGGQAGADSVGNVLVIWFSKDPRTNKAVIVGWYQNAMVYRKVRVPKVGEGHKLNGDPIWYKATAAATDCKCLDLPQRTFAIPSRSQESGGYGQNPNWYGLGEDFLNSVWRYIQNHGVQQRPSKERGGRPPFHNSDHEKRRMVEDTAIRFAFEFYASPAGGNRTVKSVELEAKGWDLEAKGPLDELLVEVKGLSGRIPLAELTPNEYAKMRQHKGLWVLFIVTDCLSVKPQHHEFRYMHDAGRWETTTGTVLNVAEKVAAIVGV